MKIILTEQQYTDIKSRIYDRFIDVLVNDTIFSDVEDYHNSNKFKYITYVKYPFFDDEYELLFRNSESWVLGVPARYHLENMLMVVGVDSNKTPKIAQAIWEEYIDRLEIKIKDFLKEFIENED